MGMTLPIMYNDTANRMVISIRCPESHVGIEFVFEPGIPFLTIFGFEPSLNHFIKAHQWSLVPDKSLFHKGVS